MPKVQFRLEEQFSDLRSNEVAYKFIVENLSTSPIELHSITPRIPEDVTLLEIRDPSLIALKSKHNALCEELTTLLNVHMVMTMDKFRKIYAEMIKQVIDEVIDDLKFVFRAYYRLLSGTHTSSIQAKLKKAEAYRIKIENFEQAQEAFQKWVTSDSGVDKSLKDLFEAKTQRLGALEKEMGPNLKSSSLATIEPESFFAITYVLKFRRGKWDGKKYNIAIEGVYSDVSEIDRRHVGGATVSLTISPNPLAMSIIAIVASILGLTLKTAMGIGANDLQPYLAINGVALSFQAVAATILALIFFNEYEFTDLGKKAGIVGIGWRSALFIGSLCGLFGDRILLAIKTLLGI